MCPGPAQPPAVRRQAALDARSCETGRVTSHDDDTPAAGIRVQTTHVDSASGPGSTVSRVELDPLYANELKLTFDVSPAEVVAWLEHHGHRAWYAGHAPGADADTAVMFDHGPDTPARAALPGNTLTVRDNGTIVVS